MSATAICCNESSIALQGFASAISIEEAEAKKEARREALRKAAADSAATGVGEVRAQPPHQPYSAPK